MAPARAGNTSGRKAAHRRARSTFARLMLSVLLASCGTEPGAVDSFQLHLVDQLPARVAPGDTVLVSFRVVDAAGSIVQGVKVGWALEGAGARLLTRDPHTDMNGLAVARWVIGTNASVAYRLEARVIETFRVGVGRVEIVPVPDRIARLVLADSLAVRLFSRSTLVVSAVDPYGNIFRPLTLQFSTSDSSLFTVDPAGVVMSFHRGLGWARVVAEAASDSLPVRVYQLPSTITSVDTLSFHALGQVIEIPFSILGGDGVPVRDSIPDFTLTDPSLATIVPGSASDSAVRVLGHDNGGTILKISLGTLSTEVNVIVKQVTARLEILPTHQLVFDALGDSLLLNASALDSLDVPVEGATFAFTTSDPAVAMVQATGLVSSVGNGSGIIEVAEAQGLRDSLTFVVTQRAVNLTVTIDSPAIVLLSSSQPFPVSCVAHDRNGFILDSVAAVSAHGTLTGNQCDMLAAVHSGFDTLIVQTDTLLRRVPYVLALPPQVTSPLGHPIAVDSLPPKIVPWAPSLVRNPAGDLDLYFGGYFATLGAPTGLRGDLYRLTSSDEGATFKFQGIALARDTAPCSPEGDGIENIAIAPRSDAAGWRMFYSSGGFTCYGWQVFSATSTDQVHWTREPGVRVSNGSPFPPAAPGPVPWPSGEGMVVDEVSPGTWRMISGTYEPLTPSGNKFEIVEHRSNDQLHWTYDGPLITTAMVGPSAQRSVYSPTIREYVPGVFRMIFTGDNLNQSGGRSRLYSAVSTDRVTWQLEGELMGDSSTNIYYSALVDSVLAFIRWDDGQPRFLGTTQVLMP
ncbi:MAG: hypothetical protein ABI613_03400 [Gemmatimonadota bacterium]